MLSWRQATLFFAISCIAHYAAFTAAIAGFSYIPAVSSDKAAAFRTRSVAAVADSAVQAKPAPVAKPAVPTPARKPSSNQNPVVLPTPDFASHAPAQVVQVQPEALAPPPSVQTFSIREPETKTVASNAPNTPTVSVAAEPAPPLPQLQFPSAISLAYNATVTRRGQPSQGSGQLSWRSDGQRYELRLDSSAAFFTVLAQSSVGSITPLGLAPERFADKRFNRSEQAVHFRAKTEEADARIEFSNNKSPARLLPGAQDRLSMLVQLAALIAGQPERYGAGASITFQVANLTQAQVWEIKVIGTEVVDTPAGSLQALKLLRTPRDEYDQRLELWLAPSLSYLPVRILQTGREDAVNNSFELALRKLP